MRRELSTLGAFALLAVVGSLFWIVIVAAGIWVYALLSGWHTAPHDACPAPGLVRHANHDSAGDSRRSADSVRNARAGE